MIQKFALKGRRRFISLAASAVLVLAMLLGTTLSASAHGCVRSPGYFKTHLDVVAESLPLDTGLRVVSTTQEAYAVLSYGGPDPALTLEKFVLTTSIILHSGMADMQGDTFAAKNEAYQLLASGSTDYARMRQLQSILDNYVNGTGNPLDPRPCS